MGFYETMEIESFYQELIKDESVQDALINELGLEISNNIIRQFNSGISYNNIQEDFEDVIINCIEENAIVEDTLTGIGGYGKFPIEILNFGHYIGFLLKISIQLNILKLLKMPLLVLSLNMSHF